MKRENLSFLYTLKATDDLWWHNSYLGRYARPIQLDCIDYVFKATTMFITPISNMNIIPDNLSDIFLDIRAFH